jgi:uncharacterized membrane protein
MILCGIVHAATAVEHWAASPMLAAVTLVVALACLHCVPALWREPRRVDWVRLSIGSVAMACLHLAMIVTMSGPTGGGHGQHAAAGLAGAAAVSGAATLLGLLLPVLCLGLAWWALGRLMPSFPLDELESCNAQRARI